MILDGSAVHYLLSQEFGDVVYDYPTRSVSVDYPMLYDVSTDMSGHAILVPEHEHPSGGPRMRDALCVCMGEASAKSAREAGLATIEIRGGVTFPQMYNYMQETFVNFVQLDAQLNAYVDAHAGFRVILDAFTRAMKCSCVLVDRQYRIVYQATFNDSGQSADAPDMFEADEVDLFMASSGYRHMRSSHSVFTVPGSSDLLMKNVFAGNELIGMLAARHEGNALSARYVRFILGYIAPFVERMYMRLGSFGESGFGAERVRIALGKAISGDVAGIADLEKALVEDGHDVNAHYVAVRIERSFTNDGPEERDYVARRFETAWRNVYCFTFDQALCMLVDTDTVSTDGRSPFVPGVASFARDNLAKVGVSREFEFMAQLVASCHQAAAALSCGVKLDPTKWFYRFEEYALPWLVMRARGDEPTESFRHPAVGVLAAYDEGRGSDLVETLDCFMRCRFNATAAASELYIARSTLLNRLERIEELTGIDLEDADELLYLALSLKM